MKTGLAFIAMAVAAEAFVAPSRYSSTAKTNIIYNVQQ